MDRDGERDRGRDLGRDSRLRVCLVGSAGEVDPVVGEALAAAGLEQVVVPSVATAATAAAADAYIVAVDGPGAASRVADIAILRAITSAAILVLSRDPNPIVHRSFLSAGADDVLCHAWGLTDLGPRVQLRALAAADRTADEPVARSAASGSGAERPLVLTPDGHALVVRGHPVTLTPRERDLLTLLMSQPGRLFTRDELLASIWGGEWSSDAIVTEYVRRIRTSLKPHGADGCLVTRHRYGYLWDPQRLADG